MTTLDESLQWVADLLRARQWKLAVAESLTAGHVQSMIASQSGASDYFVGGATVYTIETKIRLLGVDRDLALACNGVSEQVAEEMAVGCLRLFQADLAIATTGYAEPSPAWKVDRPFAYCCAALRWNETIPCFTQRIDAEGHRTDVQRDIADFAIRHLCSVLMTNT